MTKLSSQYIPEYNYYCAITGYRGKFSTWLKWRDQQAVKQFN